MTFVLIISILIILSLPLFYFIHKMLIKRKELLIHFVINLNEKKITYTALIVFSISLLMDWGIKKFWIWHWGNFDAKDIFDPRFAVYILLLVGWYYPVYQILTNKELDIFLLRFYTLLNLMLPFLVSVFFHYTTHTFVSSGPIFYFLASMLLYIATEIYINKIINYELAQED